MDIEILVHVSAPTTRARDDRYRTEAIAYFDFETCDEVLVEGVDQESSENAAHLSLPKLAGKEVVARKDGPCPASEGSGSEAPILSPSLRPVQEVRSLVAACDEPFGSCPSAVCCTRQMECHVHSNDRPLSDPESTDSESWGPRSRIEQLELLQAQWKRRYRFNSSANQSNLKSSAQATVSTPVQHGGVFLQDTQIAGNALESQLYNSPATPWNRILTSPSREKFRQDLSSPYCSSPTKLDTAICAHLDVVPRGSNTPTRVGNGDCIENNAAEHLEPFAAPNAPSVMGTEITCNGEPEMRPAAHLGSKDLGVFEPSRDKENVERFCAEFLTPLFQAEGSSEAIQRPQTVPLDFKFLPTEVFPPAPSPSLKMHSKLPSQSTKLLEAIKQQNHGRFQPRKVSRALDTDERGYWFLETESWPKRVQLDFWHTLSDYISAGHFGWGVTLHREVPHSRVYSQGSMEGLGKIRLYCWAEIIEHTYLYLWLCSSGRISGSSLKWYDADDIVVVEMA